MVSGPFVFSYKNLWDYLVKIGDTKADFCKKVGMSSATLAKMHRHEKLSDSTLERICKVYGFNKPENIYEFKSDMMVWLEDINNIVDSEGYSLYLNNWPKFVFYLTDMQMQFLKGIEGQQLTDIINQVEIIADRENRPNAGIIGSTKIISDPDGRNRFGKEAKILIIQGSFAVIEKIITVLFLGGTLEK